MIKHIDHINFVVSDLDLMLGFYRDALGLKVTKRVSISGDWIDRVVGLQGSQADVVYLETSEGPRIELIRYHHPPGPNPPKRDLPHACGLRHLAFRVCNIDTIVNQLKIAGIEFFSDVQQVPASQVTYADGASKRLVYFRDPEGNLLEFCEYK